MKLITTTSGFSKIDIFKKIREIDTNLETFGMKMSCEDATDLYFVKNPGEGQEKFKLLQQAHCASCWRPLRYNTVWPGSSENLRPPFHYTLRTPMAVSQCGHVFHLPCATQVSHCPICRVLIQK